jgi:hypothetical protein
MPSPNNDLQWINLMENKENLSMRELSESLQRLWRIRWFKNNARLLTSPKVILGTLPN